MGNDQKFWSQAPIYIVICVLLGFVIAGLFAQNTVLKDRLDATTAQLEQVKKAQEESKQRGDRIEENTDRVINYLRCISLTPVGERTAALVDKCLEQDLPAQPKAEGSTGGTSFLPQAPRRGSSQPGSSSSPSTSTPGGNGGNSNNGGNTDPTPDNTGGLLTPVINPLCINLTPRVCATLGL